jgi:hypothetical protein
MEENKKVIGSDQSNIQEAEEVTTSLPGFSIQYNEESTTENDIEPSERIPNSLALALSNRAKDTAEEMEKRYGVKITDEELKEVVDEEGKPKKLTKRQDRILLAFSSEVSRHIKEDGIRELAEKIASGEKVDPNSIAHFFVSMEELCRKVEGKEEKWKKKKQEAIEEELKKISHIKQIQIFKIRRKIGTDKNGKDKFDTITYKAVDPYIALTGKTREVQIGKRTSKAVEVVFGRVFLESIEKRSAPILDSYWELQDSNGTRIYTAIFNDLSKLVFRLRWSHIYHDLTDAENYIKAEGILDPEKAESIRKKALTHAPISVERIKSITNAEYNSTRKRRKDFWKDLWEALRALIVYGIITTDTTIDQEKGEVVLVYNADFDTPKQTSLPINGGYWKENPYK